MSLTPADPTVHADGMFEDEISRIALAALDMVRHLLALLPPDTTAGLDTRRLRRQPAPALAGLRRWQPDLEMGCATFGGRRCSTRAAAAKTPRVLIFRDA